MADPRVRSGRAAFERKSWMDAYTHLSEAAETSPLEVDDLERMAVSAYLVSYEEASTDAWMRAHQQHLSAGSPQGAARSAFWLAFALMDRGDVVQAQGWLTRAERILEESGVECAERGYLMLPSALQSMAQGDWAGAREICESMVRSGERFHDRDLATFGRLGFGQCLIALGRVSDGLMELDQVMVSVTADEVSPVVAGISYCAVIEACHSAFDLRRAQEWTDALSRWCASQPDLVPYKGQCLVHRSELMQFRGAWSEALEEAGKARERLSDPPGQPAVGMAFYQLGEINRLRGDLDQAEDAYKRAHEHGRQPDPGLALLRLAQGRVDLAAASSTRSLGEATARVARAKLLPAHVEIMLAAGDAAEARSASEELTELAAELDVPLFQALAARARGALLLESDDIVSALDQLRVSCAIWRELDAPYETARTRVLLSLACRRLGDEDTAVMELGSARSTFEQLGAALDLSRPSRSSDPADGLTPREVEVLGLVATGRTNRVIAEELVISEKTVARHISNIFIKLGLSSRAAATAYAYEHDLV